jgi:hypothetical protein
MLSNIDMFRGGVYEFTSPIKYMEMAIYNYNFPEG